MNIEIYAPFQSSNLLFISDVILLYKLQQVHTFLTTSFIDAATVQYVTIIIV